MHYTLHTGDTRTTHYTQVTGALAAAADVPSAFPAYVPPPEGLFVGHTQQQQQQQQQQGGGSQQGGSVGGRDAGDESGGATNAGAGPMDASGGSDEEEEEEEEMQVALEEYQRWGFGYALWG